MAALSGEVSLALFSKLRASASKILAEEKVLREAAEKTAKNADEVEQVDDLIDELYKFFDIEGASKTIYKEVKTLEKIYTEGSKVNFEKGVKYLNEAERTEFEIFVQHDRIIDKNGKLFDTNGSIEIGIDGKPIPSNKAIFVMSEKGEIFISKQNEIGKFHHSSFLAGEKVAAAGDIIIEKGIIKQISNQSGHYKPIIEQVKRNLLKELSTRNYFSTGTNKEENIKFITGF
jgi:hypothetical protein